MNAETEIAKSQDGQVVPIQTGHTDAEGLIAIALNREQPLDTAVLSALLDMRREFNQEKSRAEYFTALAKFQAACPIIKKTKEVMNKDRKSVRYRYTPIEDIIAQAGPFLAKNDFSYTFDRKDSPAFMSVTCTLHHCGGHSMSATREIPLVTGYGTNEAQDSGSAHTYGRRLSFCDVTGIATADNDDDAASTGPDNAAKLLKHNAAVREWLPSILCIKENLIEGGDIDAAAEAYAEFPRQILFDLNLAPTKGGIWTTEEGKQFGANKEFRDLVQIRRKDAGWHEDNQI